MNTQTSSTPFRPLALTAAYYLSFIMLGMLIAAEGPALPSLAENTGSTLDEISMIFLFGSLGYLLGSFFGGQAYDRLPGHRLMAATLLVVTVSASIIPMVHNLWLLLVVLFFLGLAKGALDVGGNALLLWVHGEKAGPFMNGLHFFFGLGAFFSPLLLAGFLSITGGILWTFWLFALLSLPLAAWLWHLPEPPTHDPANNGESPFPMVPVVLLVLAFLFSVGAELGFGNWVYTYALTVGLGTTITAAYLSSAFWGTLTLGRLLGVWISTRLRASTIIFLDLVGCIVSLIPILLWHDSSPALWIGSIGFGLFTASIIPSILILARERMPVTGTITGWLLVGSGAGGMILPWGIGQAFARLGAWVMPVLVIGTVAVDLLVVVLFLVRPVKTLQTAKT